MCSGTSFPRYFSDASLPSAHRITLRRSQVPLERYFSEYTGGSDINKAAKFILWRFMQANRAHLSVYPQYVGFLQPTRNLMLKSFLSSLTQATDTKNVRLVFAAVKETILQNALKDSGIL
jgi:guanine nucleotide-binding protein G(i) subunit alpha